MLITRKSELCINGQHIVGRVQSLLLKLELCSPSACNGPTARITVFAMSSTMYTPRAWQIWTKMVPARFSHWQMTGWYIYTKRQGTPAPSRQPKQCSNNWIAYPSSVTTPDLSSIQTRHKHCCARLTTEQQTNRCQQSHLMELWSIHLGIHFGRMLTNRRENNSTEGQERSINPEDYGCNGYWTVSPLPTISKCVAVTDYGLGLTTITQTNLLKEGRTRKCESNREPPRTRPPRPWGSH